MSRRHRSKGRNGHMAAANRHINRYLLHLQRRGPLVESSADDVRIAAIRGNQGAIRLLENNKDIDALESVALGSSERGSTAAVGAIARVHSHLGSDAFIKEDVILALRSAAEGSPVKAAREAAAKALEQFEAPNAARLD